MTAGAIEGGLVISVRFFFIMRARESRRRRCDDDEEEAARVVGGGARGVRGKKMRFRGVATEWLRVVVRDRKIRRAMCSDVGMHASVIFCSIRMRARCDAIGDRWGPERDARGRGCLARSGGIAGWRGWVGGWMDVFFC